MTTTVTMDGNFHDQVRALQRKTAIFAECIRTSSLTHQEAWQALHTTILKTIEYPMEAISLNYQQWHSIMKPLIQAAVPKAGLTSTFPHNILYGPFNQLGLNLPHPYHMQFIRQLKIVLNIDNIAPATKARLEAGWTGSLDAMPMEIVKSYITSSWWTSLLTYCSQHNIQFRDPLPPLQLHTPGDKAMMEMFVTNGGYRGKELHQLNMCCMYLSVMFVSDICSLDGLTLERWALQGHPQWLTSHVLAQRPFP